jgi:hypothetical protein
MGVTLLCWSGMCVAEDRLATEQSARLGFVEILELWRQERYPELYSRLDPPAGHGWEYFAERIVHSSRVPACCWEQLQDVTTTLVDGNSVLLTARLGLESEGIGVRFVSRRFLLTKREGVWRLPMIDLLDLAEYNPQRLPRQIILRAPTSPSPN